LQEIDIAIAGGYSLESLRKRMQTRFSRLASHAEREGVTESAPPANRTDRVHDGGLTRAEEDRTALADLTLSGTRAGTPSPIPSPAGPDTLAEDKMREVLTTYEAALQEDMNEGGDEAAQALESARNELLALLRSRPEDRDARIVELEKLVDRAYKMMQMAGYRITSQDTEHNNPLVSWMSDVRALKPSPSALNPKAAWPFPDATMSQQEKKDG
jgi:hypothetical protein